MNILHNAKTKLAIAIIFVAGIFYFFSTEGDGNNPNRSGVQITTNTDATVELDSNPVGKTPYYSESLDQNSVNVRITQANTGQTWKEEVPLKKGTLTIVHRDFGDQDYKSSGYILSFENIEASDGARVKITNQSGISSIDVDGISYGDTPYEFPLEPKEHIFTFKAPGYRDKIIHASTIQGYQLNMGFTMASIDTYPGVNEFSVKVGDNTVVLSPSYILINPEELFSNKKELKINNSDYPELFVFNNTPTRLIAEPYKRTSNAESNLIYISGQVPNRGSVSDYFYIIVDPDLGKVVDAGHNWTFGNMYLNDTCSSCALPILMFREYSKVYQRFVLVNSKYRKDFQNLLKKYEDFNSEANCKLNGKFIPLAEALKNAKDDDRCEPPLENMKDGVISLGEYRQVISNIKKIIQGENNPMTSDTYHGEELFHISESQVPISNSCDSIKKQLEVDKTIEKYTGSNSPINFASYPEAKTFKTTLTNSYNDGPNFAGHYNLGHFGCGTDCFGMAITDVKTGQIIEFSPVHESYVLDGYEINNRLFILNPVSAGMERKYYKLNELSQQLELICREISTQDMYSFPK